MGWRALLGGPQSQSVGLDRWRTASLEPIGFRALRLSWRSSRSIANLRLHRRADDDDRRRRHRHLRRRCLSSRRRSASSSTASVCGAHPPGLGLALAGIIIIAASGLGQGRLLGQAVSMLMTLAFGPMRVLLARRPARVDDRRQCVGALGSGSSVSANSPLEPISLTRSAILFVFGLTTIGLAFVLFIEGRSHPVRRSRLISLLDACARADMGVYRLRRNPGLATIQGGADRVAAAVWRIARKLMRAFRKVKGGPWTASVSPW